MLRLGTIRGLAILGLALLIPACGGGGGGGAPVADSVQFSAATYAALETDGTATIFVTRGGGGGAVSVNYATSNGTAGAADFTASSGTLSWPAGDTTSKAFTVPVLTDALTEGDETVALSLSLVSGGAIIGTQKTATLTLGDTNGPPEGVFQLSATAYNVAEGAATVQATVTVTRTGGSTGAAVANVLLSDGSAVGGVDYTVPLVNPVVVNFAAGETSKSFTVDILPSATAGAVKTIDLDLTSPAAPPDLGTTIASVINIIDRDVPGTVQLTTGTDSVFESGSLVTITVSRINGCGGAASVQAAVADGSALAGTHYTAPTPNPVVLNWADGDFADKTFTVAVTDNALVNPDRTFTVTLGTPLVVALGGTTVETVTILDDEPGQLAFSSISYSRAENAVTSFAITVTRTGGSLGVVTVQVVDLLTGTATLANSDYTAFSPALLTWPSGTSGDQSFNITVIGDTDVETDETIELQLQNPTGGATLGLQTTATATITNDDVPLNGTFQFNIASMTGVEGGMANIIVERVGGSTGTVTVTVSTSNGSAKSNGNPANRDFVAVTNQVLTFVATDVSETFSVQLTTNPVGVIEGMENFFVTLSAPTGGATIAAGSVGPQPVTITE